MRNALLLAWRYMSFHRVRTVLLVLCIALTFLLPVAVQLLVGHYSAALAARAEATPLVVGARGSRYDLVLNSLYFKGRVPRPWQMAEAERIQDSGLGLAIPVLGGYTAQGYPVIGTSYDYFGFRSLSLRAGTYPLILGDAVVGSRVADELDLGAGDTLLTDRGSLYDLSMKYPLKMSVVGVLAESGTPDDGAVFVDVKTAWIIAGLGHGHEGAEAATDDRILGRSENGVVFNASMVEYTEITGDNIDSFHFHGDLGQFPLTAILIDPRDAKGATILKGRYRVSETAQLLVPGEVIDEILGFILRVKRFFDANLVLVSAATVLFLVLIVLLSLRVRHREVETLNRIGCARLTVFKVMATELLLCVGFGLALAAIVASGLVVFLSRGLV